jgi:hypothetical protein
MDYEFEYIAEFGYGDTISGTYKVILTVDQNLEYDGKYEGGIITDGETEKEATWDEIKQFVEHPVTFSHVFENMSNEIEDVIGSDFNEDGTRDKY